jgi:hypothetical protein
MQSLVCSLGVAFTKDPILSIPFFPLFHGLLLYREPKQDDDQIPNDTGALLCFAFLGVITIFLALCLFYWSVSCYIYCYLSK